MKINTIIYSYRFAEQVLNSKLAIKQEIEDTIKDPSIELSLLSRPYFNKILDLAFCKKGWERQPAVFGEQGDPTAKMDFLKDRVGMEVEFGHASFIGIDVLKFQIGSYSGIDKIDLGIYIVTTNEFQKQIMQHLFCKIDHRSSQNPQLLTILIPNLNTIYHTPILPRLP